MSRSVTTSFPSANHLTADLWQEPSGDIRKDLSEWFPDDLDSQRFSNALEGAVMEHEDPMAPVPVGSVWETHLVLFVRLTHPRRIANLEHIAKSETTIIERMTGERLIVWVSEFRKKTAFDVTTAIPALALKRRTQSFSLASRHGAANNSYEKVIYNSENSFAANLSLTPEFLHSLLINPMCSDYSPSK